MCTALAALSLLLPSTLTYDSWSWLTWGREVTHLDLDTSGFIAAWKPLPVLAAVLFSYAGRFAPALWLLVARAGGLVAVVFSYRLARRSVGIAGGTFAALALLSSAGFTGYLLPLGMSEPLLAGIALAAVERHLDRHNLQTLMLVYAAALLRPEAWPFLGLYVLWLWRAERQRRVLITMLVMFLPVLWFAPDLLGSGDALRTLHRAAVPTQGGPLLSGHPGLALLRDAARYLPVPFALAAVAAAVLGGGRRRGYDRVTLTVVAITVSWIAIAVVITQAGRSSGDQRYLIVAGAGASVLAGIGCARIVQAAGRLAARLADDDHLVTAGRAVGPLLLVGAVAGLTDLRTKLDGIQRDILAAGGQR